MWPWKKSVNGKKSLMLKVSLHTGKGKGKTFFAELAFSYFEENWRYKSLAKMPCCCQFVKRLSRKSHIDFIMNTFITIGTLLLYSAVSAIPVQDGKGADEKVELWCIKVMPHADLEHDLTVGSNGTHLFWPEGMFWEQNIYALKRAISRVSRLALQLQSLGNNVAVIAKRL